MPKTVRKVIIVLFVDFTEFHESNATGRAIYFTKIKQTRRLELQVLGKLSFITTQSTTQNRDQSNRDLP